MFAIANQPRRSGFAITSNSAIFAFSIAPPVAFAIGTGRAEGLLGQRLSQLRDKLAQAPDIDSAIVTSAASWPGVNLGRGMRAWKRTVAAGLRSRSLRNPKHGTVTHPKIIIESPVLAGS